MLFSIKVLDKDKKKRFERAISKEFTKINSNEKYVDYLYKNLDGEIKFWSSGTVMFNLDCEWNKYDNILSLLAEDYRKIGVDETGKGEIIGPIISCSAKYKNKQSEIELMKYGIKDSKKLKREDIDKIHEQIDKYCITSCKLLLPKNLNQFMEKGVNLNEIISSLHYSTIKNIKAKGEYSVIIIDKFVSLDKFNTYLLNKVNITRNDLNDIEMYYKAEDYHRIVAIASINAKYLYNKYIFDIKKKHHLNINENNTYKLVNEIKEKCSKSEQDSLIKKYKTK